MAAVRGLGLRIALLGFLAVIGLVRAASQTACLGSSCPPANLTCPSPLVLAPVSAQQGFKATSSICTPPGPECPQDGCCQQEPGDCLKSFSPPSLLGLAAQCWGSPQCQPSTPSPDSSGCNFTTRGTASYALYQYACVDESKILSFLSSEPVVEETAVMRLSVNQSHGEEAWSCYVEPSDCLPRHASVFLYVNSTQTSPPTACSTMSIDGVSMSCDVAAALTDVTLPVRIGVTLTSNHNISSAWAAVRAEDGSAVRVWCGLNQTSPKPPTKCAETTPSATALTTPTAGETEARNQAASLVAATAVGWVLAVLALIATVVLLVLLLRRQGKLPGFLGIFSKKTTTTMSLPDAAALEASSQVTSSPAVTSQRSAVTGLQAEASKPSENAYMDMEGNAKNSVKGANSRQSSHPAPVVASEEEYSPLETQGQEGEMYSPLEVEGDENEYQDMPQEEIYENA